MPVVFVHGNGDSAALWMTTIWRFESNGYDSSLLHAIDLTAPLAPQLDTAPEPNRSTTVDQAAQLAAAVTRALVASGAPRVALVGSSRGGNTIRNFVRYGGGANAVARIVLCGTPNHGVFRSPQSIESEWNGEGRFLTRLNAGREIVEGPSWTTIRSDRNDKYAQPPKPAGTDGSGPSVQNSGVESPALEGASNVVLDGLDHREVAFHPRAFAVMYRAITGRAPETLDIVSEPAPVLDGVVSGVASGGPTNQPLGGVDVDVYEVDPDTGMRKGAAMHHRTTGADGRWGPFRANAAAYYEFVASASGYPTIHTFRTPFPRSSAVVHVRLAPMPEPVPTGGGLVILTRPRGYLGVGRDVFTFDGRAPADVRAGVPTVSTSTLVTPAGPATSVRVRLNDEALTVRTFPIADHHVVFAEFHH
ncbi:MAG: hypothetical protein U0Q12_23385 [Vicinamibacterales bacterium]